MPDRRRLPAAAGGQDVDRGARGQRRPRHPIERHLVRWRWRRHHRRLVQGQGRPFARHQRCSPPGGVADQPAPTPPFLPRPERSQQRRYAAARGHGYPGVEGAAHRKRRLGGRGPARSSERLLRTDAFPRERDRALPAGHDQSVRRRSLVGSRARERRVLQRADHRPGRARADVVLAGPEVGEQPGEPVGEQRRRTDLARALSQPATGWLPEPLALARRRGILRARRAARHAHHAGHGGWA